VSSLNRSKVADQTVMGVVQAEEEAESEGFNSNSYRDDGQKVNTHTIQCNINKNRQGLTEQTETKCRHKSNNKDVITKDNDDDADEQVRVNEAVSAGVETKDSGKCSADEDSMVQTMLVTSTFKDQSF